MAMKLKLRLEAKGDRVMAIPVWGNGRPVAFNEPLPAPKANQLTQALTKDQINFTIDDRTDPSMIGRGPGRPRTTGRTAMAGGGSDASLTAGMARGGNGKTTRAATTTTTMPRKRGRPRRTPIS